LVEGGKKSDVGISPVAVFAVDEGQQNGGEDQGIL
jgi:hypothetical protein